jgi:hypothetical protein
VTISPLTETAARLVERLLPLLVPERPFALGWRFASNQFVKGKMGGRFFARSLHRVEPKPTIGLLQITEHFMRKAAIDITPNVRRQPMVPDSNSVYCLSPLAVLRLSIPPL